MPPFPPAPAREPVFNLPACVVVVGGLLVLIQFVRGLISVEMDVEVLTTFAFIPVRYHLPDLGFFSETGLGPRLWTPVTYALLHADWMHMGINLVWLVAFGTPLGRRFGMVRFCLFYAVTAAGGAGMHYLTYSEGLVPLVGASGAVSGIMAGAVRFTFAPGGPLSGQRSFGRAEHHPAHSLREGLGDRRVLMFVLLWMGLNLLFGIGIDMPGMEGAQIAWQAHIGGFMAGLLLFGLFDPVPRRRRV